jgi:hypothetical protein
VADTDKRDDDRVTIEVTVDREALARLGGNGVEHPMQFPRQRSRTTADQARALCHFLIDYLPDDEIQDIKADLLDKSSIYMTLDRQRIPRRLEQESGPRERRGTFGPVLASKA